MDIRDEHAGYKRMIDRSKYRTPANLYLIFGKRGCGHPVNTPPDGQQATP